MSKAVASRATALNSQGGHGRVQHRVGYAAVVAALLPPKHLLPCNTCDPYLSESANIPGVGSHKVDLLLKRTKISPHPHNASVREDMMKDYIHTRGVIQSRATSAPTSCSPIHAMACRHKKHATKHWHEDSYIRDTSKYSPKGGREEGCGCNCSKFLSSSWGDLTCVWKKHDHSKTCSEYTTRVELSMPVASRPRRLPRQCFNYFTVCCQFSFPPQQ